MDSRPSEHDSIRRRRQCERCGFRYTTYERREEMPLMVVKRDGHREPFERQKVMRGLLAATTKRNIPVERLEALIDDVEAEIRDGGGSEATSEQIGSMVLRRLVDVDKVAYVRFASVYRDFKDVEEFEKELRSIDGQA